MTGLPRAAHVPAPATLPLELKRTEKVRTKRSVLRRVEETATTGDVNRHSAIQLSKKSRSLTAWCAHQPPRECPRVARRAFRQRGPLECPTQLLLQLSRVRLGFPAAFY